MKITDSNLDLASDLLGVDKRRLREFVAQEQHKRSSYPHKPSYSLKSLKTEDPSFFLDPFNKEIDEILNDLNTLEAATPSHTIVTTDQTLAQLKAEFDEVTATLDTMMTLLPTTPYGKIDMPVRYSGTLPRRRKPKKAKRARKYSYSDYKQNTQ